ncbi:MAG: hypothetical protein QF910_08620 [Myxococcota bacterium]|nr:hypothetical protein [Myxococcota bacterium]
MPGSRIRSAARVHAAAARPGAGHDRHPAGNPLGRTGDALEVSPKHRPRCGDGCKSRRDRNAIGEHPQIAERLRRERDALLAEHRGDAPAAFDRVQREPLRQLGYVDEVQTGEENRPCP